MDSDIIRAEIDRTTDRINDRLSILATRTEEARRAARQWATVAAIAIAIGMAATAVLRLARARRHRAP